MAMPDNSYRRKLIPGLVLGFLVFLGIILIGDVRQVSVIVKAFRWELFPLILLFTLFNYTLRFVKWHYYLNQIGVHQITWHESLKLFVGGFPLAVTPGKVGEVIKAIWVNQRSGLPVPKGVSVVVAERISDGLAVLMLSTLGVITYPKYWPAFLIVLILLLSIIIISQIRPLANFLLDVGERISLIKRWIHLLRDFYEGSFSLFHPRATFLAVGLGTISWFGEGIGFYLILIGLGLTPGRELFGIAVFILAFSTVIGAVSTLPGGLGAAEASIAGMLVLILSPGAAVASAATLLVRLATLWFSIILGLCVWLLFPELIGMKKYV
jgi:uncharacterized protein (TIRG00374 family)